MSVMGTKKERNKGENDSGDLFCSPGEPVTQFRAGFYVDGNLGYEISEVDEWVEAALEYINLLQDELDRSAGYLYVHGWKVKDETVQRGIELRAMLGVKGSGE